MIYAQKINENGILSREEVRQTLEKGLAGKYSGKRILVLIPDQTRSLPLPFLTRVLAEILHNAKKLDFMIALGTHPPLNETQINKLVGCTVEERSSIFAEVNFFNHDWKDPSVLMSLDTMEQDEIKDLAGVCWHKSLPDRIPIQINKKIMDYDHLLILGPTFPHEVVGYSGGVKYLFPGISGAEMINATHWLGALAGVVGTIGKRDTPVRSMIQAAAERVPIPVTLVALTVEGDELSGIFIGDQFDTWQAAADLSAERHIIWSDDPYQQVLSCAPAMYDELWTAAKAMYKLESAVALGGEVIIFAPHLEVISHTHGEYINQVGYHTLPYFLNNWEKFKDIPLGVLAHSTHLRGSGKMENNLEIPNVKVTLASKIPAEVCTHLNLGYLDPASIDLEDWKGRENEGVLYVPKAGEMLYRLKE